jgi:hypothetical protein
MRIIKHLTKRGRVVLIYVPAAIAVTALLVWISCNVWYTGAGYCIGSMVSCFA